MANTSSAKKAIRVTERRSIINLRKRREYKEARKQVMKAVSEKNKDKAISLMPSAQKMIDKATKIKILHRNTAARYKSQLAKMVKSI